MATQYFHQVGNNLLSALIFFQPKDVHDRDKYQFTAQDIERLIKKYSLDTNAPNKIVKPYKDTAWCRWYEHKLKASDMTATYQTTFGRVLNVLFQYARHSLPLIPRFKEVIKLLLSTCDLRELEKILHWYHHQNKDSSPELIESIQKIDAELNLSAIQQQVKMRECSSSHSLFRNEDLLPLVQGFLNTHVPEKRTLVGKKQ
ncbi:MAG: hypothetical protein ACYCQI_02510 [Gammaproteobacteria bacterium]